jgi:nucleotide-binding universal stress UspA family protein
VQTATKDTAEDRLIAEVAKCHLDPLRFVRLAFPWGEAGTELEHHLGPRGWQIKELEGIGEALRAGATASDAVRRAVASGHGIGKSALVSWIILWAMSTSAGTKCVVTANTEAQLRTKTWPEVAKWHRMSICSHWFTFTATALYSVDEAHEKTWRADAIPWSETNTEAFAGMHNQGKRILLVFDEASAIADRIWEVAEGALTDADTQIVWAAFGNPTRNTGRFRECFGRFAHRWTHRQIDSRTVEGTNKAQIDQWVADYGEDSDFVRVRVRGQFPRAGSTQFIAGDVVEAAAKREAVAHLSDALVLGVDVARFGDDESVIQPRRGRDARTSPARRFRGLDTMQLAAKVLEYRDDLARMGFPVDAIFVDETGVGGGVIDRLRQLGQRVIGVNNGAASDTAVEGELVANKGAECWARMRQWLPQGAIADDSDLRQQLEGREYGFNAHNEIVLERKSDMKKRGLSSPDRADALALTFAYPVVSAAAIAASGHQPQTAQIDFDPYA